MNAHHVPLRHSVEGIELVKGRGGGGGDEEIIEGAKKTKKRNNRRGKENLNGAVGKVF
jgi:hypothetical protein